jgi:hypothetical protein
MYSYTYGVDFTVFQLLKPSHVCMVILLHVAIKENMKKFLPPKAIIFFPLTQRNIQWVIPLVITNTNVTFEYFSSYLVVLIKRSSQPIIILLCFHCIDCCYVKKIEFTL